MLADFNNIGNHTDPQLPAVPERIFQVLRLRMTVTVRLVT
jgi:hypothetical protein